MINQSWSIEMIRTISMQFSFSDFVAIVFMKSCDVACLVSMEIYSILSNQKQKHPLTKLQNFLWTGCAIFTIQVSGTQLMRQWAQNSSCIFVRDRWILSRDESLRCQWLEFKFKFHFVFWALSGNKSPKCELEAWEKYWSYCFFFLLM